MNRVFVGVVVGLCLVPCVVARAEIMSFFDGSQTKVDVASGVSWDTIESNGYRFTYTRDKLFTGGTGQVIGRQVRVPWPQGVEAQAVTEGPDAPGKPSITITRVDGDVFDLKAFSAKLLANTAGAGGSFEIMPMLNGQDGLPDPVVFDATGVTGHVFSYDESTPSYLGNTSSLKGFDTYTINLYVDFAYTALTLDGAPVPEPASVAVVSMVIGGLVVRRRR